MGDGYPYVQVYVFLFLIIKKPRNHLYLDHRFFFSSNCFDDQHLLLFLLLLLLKYLFLCKFKMENSKFI